MTKSGTGTWVGDVDVGLELGDSGTWDSETRGRGTQGRKTHGRVTRGRAGTRGRDKQTTTEFAKYNFRWSRLKV